jgi:O-antigen/teichoic acid export membrane protein
LLSVNVENAKYELTRGKRLARNTVFNLIGLGAPLVVAIFAVPFLIGGLGTDRFGILTLVWAAIGYFGLFDLGLGRALTQIVAKTLGTDREQEIPTLVWTALFAMLVVGLLGTTVVFLLSRWLVMTTLKIPPGLQSETLDAFYLMALSVPLVVTTAGLRGVLDAHQRFGLANSVRIPMGVLIFLGPLLVLPFSRNLFLVATVLVVIRIIAWVAYMMLCFYVVPALRCRVRVKATMLRPLIQFGTWMTVTNIVGPLMVYLDRFLIGAVLSVSAVAYYATPYEVVTKLWIIPVAVVGVLFPAFSTSFVDDRGRTALLFDRGVKYVFLAMFPLTLLIVTLAYEGLDLWLGGKFAQNSTRVVQWLAVGVFINSLAHVAFSLVQGVGRPDITAKLHLIELPFYLISLWWLVATYGIEGAAIAWVVRIVIDTGFLFSIARRLLPTRESITLRTTVTIGTALLILVLAIFPVGIAMKGLFLLLIMPAFAMVAWFFILIAEERTLILDQFKGMSDD